MSAARTLVVTKSLSAQSLNPWGIWVFCLATCVAAVGALLITVINVGVQESSTNIATRAAVSLVQVGLAIAYAIAVRHEKRWVEGKGILVFLAYALMEIAFCPLGSVPFVIFPLILYPLVEERRQTFVLFVAGLLLVLTISSGYVSEMLGFIAEVHLSALARHSIFFGIGGGLALGLNRYLIGLKHVVDELDQNIAELGSYALLEKLGTGGMGEVWRAEHRLLKRPAAVKLIRKERLIGDDDNPERERIAVARFEREAQMTARLTSPHTVKLYDYGRSDSDGLYYAMELLHGMDLENLVTNYGRLPQERVRHLLMQLCDSLHEAHSHGLIHRDIKPANIYICQQGLKLDFVKVLDFGLAIEEQDFQSGDRLTVKGKITGSPTTMAPEQAFGESVDARADIYAMGCVAFYALTGRHVFRAASPREMLMKHVKSLPELPSTMAEITPEFEALILKCLAKERADRPQSASELHDALEALVLPGAWTQNSARAWYKENKIKIVEDAT